MTSTAYHLHADGTPLVARATRLTELGTVRLLVGDDWRSEIAIYVRDPAYAQRLADAINDAAEAPKPPVAATPAENTFVTLTFARVDGRLVCRVPAMWIDDAAITAAITALQGRLLAWRSHDVAEIVTDAAGKPMRIERAPTPKEEAALAAAERGEP